MPIQHLLHKVFAVPVLYDLAQAIAGAAKLRAMLAPEVEVLGPQGDALDLGGGTGMYRSLLPGAWRYTCLDPDPQKLSGFRLKYPNDTALEASACAIPCPDASVDLCLMVAVSHHLTSAEFTAAMAETRRVLRPGGVLLFVDAVWQPENWRGRFLWSVDRGSSPKAGSDIRRIIADHLEVEHSQEWRVHHGYLLLRGRRRAESNDKH